MQGNEKIYRVTALFVCSVSKVTLEDKTLGVPFVCKLHSTRHFQVPNASTFILCMQSLGLLRGSSKNNAFAVSALGLYQACGH